MVRTKTPTSAKAVSRQKPKSGETGKSNVEESVEKEVIGDARDVDSAKKEEFNIFGVGESLEKEEHSVENRIEAELPLVPNVGKPTSLENPGAVDVGESLENQEPDMAREENKVKEDMKEHTTTNGDKVEIKHVSANTEEDINNEMEECSDRLDLKEFGEEELVEDDMPEQGEGAKSLEEEHMELTAAAKERKIRKELEIFVGGLDRDVVEEDVKKAFEKIGEVVEVRLHKNPLTDKNKGYAFVKFSTKEQARRALSEMRTPIEAIKQKLKDYGIEGVEHITLVPDAQYEGLSRGFAFLEFSCHADAILAYKRLQKPDVIFGHPERTAKVAFSEPLHEPDPEVMAQVKSVFIDGLTPHWNEDRVREKLKGYGEIVISKTKVKARLSNPSPKIWAVKGGMCGGFRIGHGGARSFSKFGVLDVVDMHSISQTFNVAGVSINVDVVKLGEWGFPMSMTLVTNILLPIDGKRLDESGGRRDLFGSSHDASGGNAVPARPNLDRIRLEATGGGRGRHIPVRRQPFSPEEGFNGAFVGRHFDDHYFYDNSSHGIKRPFFMTDHDADYMEPSRLRPRLDYSDPAAHTHRYQDSFGADSSLYSHDYYGSDYGEDSYSSFYGNDHPYGVLVEFGSSITVL
ncbi:unnamed protein product [Camellia sinensis]